MLLPSFISTVGGRSNEDKDEDSLIVALLL
jgi:hypothetical protein